MNHSCQYFLKTERLGFRCWTIHDLPLALALWGDSEVSRLLGGPFSEEVVKKKLAGEIDLMAGSNVQYWPLFLLSDHGHVGCAGLRPYRQEQQIYELGYHLRTAYWGRGFAQEAGRALLKFAFESMGASALFAGHHPANVASRRVLERLGFRFTHDEPYPPTGLNHPSYLLKRSEWSKASAGGRSSRP